LTIQLLHPTLPQAHRIRVGKFEGQTFLESRNRLLLGKRTGKLLGQGREEAVRKEMGMCVEDRNLAEGSFHLG